MLEWINHRVIEWLTSLGFVHHRRHYVYGPVDRLHWEKSEKGTTVNILFNTRSGHVYIQQDVVIGHGVMFLTGRHQFENGRLKQPRDIQVPTVGYDIHVDRGCWIASGAIILGGVTLGAHSLVCAGAVVTKSFPSNTILAGVPAKVIGDTRTMGEAKEPPT